MATLSLPASTQINVVATTTEYSQKSNLTEKPGSYLTLATIIVYDEILRYQRGVKYTHGLTKEMVDNFNYNEFAGNVLWLMDELVGIESDWDKTASPGIKGNTAYGYVQFTEDSIDTAITRYKYHIDKFNSRRDSRDWQPYGIPLGTKLKYPNWLLALEEARLGQLVGTYYIQNYNHKNELDKLTYDQVLSLAFVHLHRSDSKDYNFVQLAKGNADIAKEIYKNNHHTNPDAATLSRLNDFFKIHYIKAPVLTNKSKELIPVTELAANDLFKIESSLYTTAVNTIKSWFGW